MRVKAPFIAVILILKSRSSSIVFLAIELVAKVFTVCLYTVIEVYKVWPAVLLCTIVYAVCIYAHSFYARIITIVTVVFFFADYFIVLAVEFCAKVFTHCFNAKAIIIVDVAPGFIVIILAVKLCTEVFAVLLYAHGFIA